MAETAKYSSWLVASDIDGTLNNKKRELQQENLVAIKEFVNKGGRLTLASDRNPESMRKHYQGLPLNGIPAIVNNGAGIYDYEKEKMISFAELSEGSKAVAVNVANRHPTVDTMIFTADSMFTAGVGFWIKIYEMYDRPTHKYYRKITDVPREGWGKIVFMGAPWRIKKVTKELEHFPDKEYVVIPNSNVSVEILAKGINKGSAALKLARFLGIEEEKTAAVGDYYNDIDMLNAVAVAGCTAEAPKAVKDISDYVTCSCNEGAVADFLSYLETKINEQN